MNLATILLAMLPFAVPEVKVEAGKDSNPVPLEWAKQAMAQQNLGGILVTSQTISTGNPDRYHKRGRRDVLGIIPEAPETSGEVLVIYWFHGLTGFSKKTFQERLVPQMKWLQQNRQERFALVVPEMPWSKFTKTQWKRQSQVFMRKNEFLKFASEAEAMLVHALGYRPHFRRIVVGHSAGGSAISSAARWGGLCRARPEAIIFSDSTYSRWFERAWQGCIGEMTKWNPVRIVVYGQSWGSPWRNYSRWAKSHAREAKRVEAHRLKRPWTHRIIGNSALKLFYGGTNEKRL